MSCTLQLSQYAIAPGWQQKSSSIKVADGSDTERVAAAHLCRAACEGPPARHRGEQEKQLSFLLWVPTPG